MANMGGDAFSGKRKLGGAAWGEVKRTVQAEPKMEKADPKEKAKKKK